MDENAVTKIEGPGRTDLGWIETGPIDAVSVQANFRYGAGGESVVVLVETSLDDGDTAVPILRFNFEKTSQRLVATATRRAVEPVEPVDGHSGPTIGILGDRLRVSIITSGTYRDDTGVAVHLCPR